MTGMPSSLAFLTAGTTASESMARMTRTLAPLEMRLSTSVSCLVGDPWASAEIYLAPWASSAFLIAASSVFQRSSWKFDHETPTVTSFASAAKETTLADASKAAPNTSLLRVLIVFLHLRSTRDRRKNYWMRGDGGSRGATTLFPRRTPAQLAKSRMRGS